LGQLISDRKEYAGAGKIDLMNRTDREINDVNGLIMKAQDAVGTMIKTQPGLFELHAGISPMILLKHLKPFIPDFIQKLTAEGAGFFTPADWRMKTSRGQEFTAKLVVGDNKLHRRQGLKLVELKDVAKAEGRKFGNAKTGAQLADDLEAGKAPLFKKIYDKMYFMAKAAGIKVAPYRKNYFPGVMLREVREVIFDDFLNLIQKNDALRDLKINSPGAEAIAKKVFESGKFKDKTAQAVKHILDTKQAKTYMEAYRMIGQAITEDVFSPFGNLESSRLAKFPADFYDRNGWRVTEYYIASWAKRMAQHEMFGSKGEKAINMLNEIRDVSPPEARIAGNMLDA
jgi:hypothetical protein